MESNYKKDRFIVILELSSTSIKTLLGMPKYVNRQPQKLDRFKSYPTVPTYLEKYIDNTKHIDIDKYQRCILPEILKIIGRIIKKPTQIIKIIATGYYRSAINSKALMELIEKEIKLLTKNKIMYVDLLSPSQESYISYLSWIKTHDFALEKERYESFFFETQIGLHIDIGGGTTEVSIFKGNNFSNTVSIPISTRKFKNQVLEQRFLSEKFLLDKSNQINLSVQDFLKQHLKKGAVIKYCVATGSSIIFNFLRDEENNQSIEYTSQLENYINEDIYLIDSVIPIYINNNEPLKRIHEIRLLRFAGVSILKGVLEYFEIKDFYINLANLRTGAYYDALEKVKGS